MLVHAIFADVFQMHVSDVLRVIADYLGRVVADAEEMADVAIHLNQRLILEMSIAKIEKLPCRLNEKSRLRLDSENDIVLSRRKEARDSTHRQIARLRLRVKAPCQ